MTGVDIAALVGALGPQAEGPTERPAYGVCPMQLQRMWDRLTICGQRNYTAEEFTLCNTQCMHYVVYLTLRSKIEQLSVETGWQKQREELQDGKNTSDDSEGGGACRKAQGAAGAAS